MPKRKSLPNFATHEEASDWLDTHSTADLYAKPVKFTVSPNVQVVIVDECNNPQVKVMALQIVDTAEVSTKEPTLQTVEKLYVFRRPLEVKEFLAAHPFLEPLLVEAYDKIGDYFEPHPEVVLEVVTDPEAIDDQELFAFIRTGLPPQEALEKLDLLDEDWWLYAGDQTDGKLCIHLEFK